MAQERRIYPRQKLNQPEMFDMGTENGGLVTDVSERGMGFQLVSPVHPKQALDFSFSLGSNRLVEAHARVVWVGSDGKSGGLEFTEVPDDTREQVRNWLQGPPPEIHTEAKLFAFNSGVAVARKEEPAIAAKQTPTLPPPFLSPFHLRESGPMFARPTLAEIDAETSGEHRKTVNFMLVILFLVAGFTLGQLFPSSGKHIVAKIEGATKSFIGTARASIAPESQNPAPAIPDSGAQPSSSPSSSTSPSPGLVPTPTARTLHRRVAASAPARRVAQEAAIPLSKPAQSPQSVATNSSSAALSDYQMGQRYLSGRGKPQDPAAAAHWFWMAEENGYAPANIALADLYLRGSGVSRSCVEAKILLTIAAKKNNQEAASKLRQLPERCD